VFGTKGEVLYRREDKGCEVSWEWTCFL